MYMYVHVLVCNVCILIAVQQLNQRLDSIRGHCEAMGYGSEINPPHMNVREQATRITESANNSLEASGRYMIVHVHVHVCRIAGNC